MEKDYIEINRKAYDRFAEQHNKRTISPSKDELSNDEWKNIIINNLIIERESYILEIGPGTGRLLQILESINCKTIAVELSKEMIKYAKLKSPKTIFIEDNILNVKFPDNTFDSIIMGALIHNFPKEDAIKLLKLAYKWLKYNGKIMLYTTIHEKSEEGYFEKQDYDGNIIRFRKKYTEQELKEMIESNNYVINYQNINFEKDRNKKWITYILQKNNIKSTIKNDCEKLSKKLMK